MENIQYPTQKETRLISQAMSGKKVNFKTEKVTCKFCKKRVKPRGLKQHQKKSRECKEKQCDLFPYRCMENEIDNVKFIMENNYNMPMIPKIEEGFRFAIVNECFDIIKYLWDADDNLILWDNFDDYLYTAYELSSSEILQWLISLFPDDYKIDKNGKPTKKFNLPLKKDECIICCEDKTCYQVNCCKKSFCEFCLNQMETIKCAHCRQSIY